MKKFLLLIFIFLLFSACAPATRNPTSPFLSPMLDGRYDNNPILVDQRLMRIQSILITSIDALAWGFKANVDCGPPAW